MTDSDELQPHAVPNDSRTPENLFARPRRHTYCVPTGPVLIYDADCGFCVRSLGWAITLGITCDNASWQSLDLSALGLTEDDVQQAAWFAHGDRRWRGHLAIAQALRTSRYLLVRMIGRGLGSRVVAPLARPAYQWIADHRYQLPGGTDNCRLDGPHG